MNFKLDKTPLLLYRRKSHKSLIIKEFRRQARPKSLITNELRVFVKLASTKLL